MKVIIAGGRDFDKEYLVAYAVKEYVQQFGDISEIVCGMAKGADMMGLNYANVHGIPVKSFPPDWSKHGKSAGPIRNKEMAAYADGLIAFWNGISRGTKNMIDFATQQGLKVKVVMY